MVESKFPDDFPAALQLHPETKEQIEPTAIMPLTEAKFTRSTVQQVPDFIHEKNEQLGIVQSNPPLLVEEKGWRLEVTDSDSVGLVIGSVFYKDVYFIFNMHVPWLAIGRVCKFEHQYFLDKKIAGPFIYIFADGFLLWARYKFGHFSTLDQAYYFLSNGSCYPLIQLTSPAVLSFVPLYIDFDLINTANTVYNYYPQGIKAFHLAVTEFSRVGGGATPVGQNYNIKLENSIPGLTASARVSFNSPDQPLQFVARWLGYDISIHPLLNLNGVEIVDRDIVYVYLMQNLASGLYGPKIELKVAVTK